MQLLKSLVWGMIAVSAAGAAQQTINVPHPTGTVAQLPRKSPEFVIHISGGTDIKVTSYKGKVVCLAFILTDCPHCQNTTRILTGVQNDYGMKGLQVLVAAIEDNSRYAVPRFIQVFHPNFPVGFIDDSQLAVEYLQHPPMMILQMPSMAFLDKQGRIVAQYEGDAPFLKEDVQDQNIRAKVAELLGLAAPKKKQ